MNAKEQLKHYESILSPLFKEFRALGKHPDMYCSWGVAINILKAQKTKIEKFGEDAYTIYRNDVFRLDEIIKEAQKALQTLKNRAAIEAEAEKIEETAKELGVEISFEFADDTTSLICVAANNGTVRKFGESLVDFTEWLRMLSLYQDSEDMEEDPSFQRMLIEKED